MNKIKIVFFVSRLGGGGAEMHLLRVANQLDRNRFEPLFAVVHAGGQYEKYLNDIPVFHIGLPLPIKSSSAHLLGAVAPFAAFLRRHRPEIICSANDDANCTALLAKRLSRIEARTVVTVQCPPSIVYGPSDGLLSKVMINLMRLLYPAADRVVPISEGVAADVRDVAPNLSPADVIYNACIDARVTERIKGREQIGLGKGATAFVACGRLVPQKGFAFLLDAMALVVKQAPAHLTILGEGPLRAQLQDQADALGIAEYVDFVGFKDNPFDYMASADVFVLSSIFEGLGMVLVEAMACGTAVVSTTCPHGPSEIVQHEKSGLLVPPEDPEALAAAMVRLIQDPELRAHLARAGQQRAKDFDAKLVGQQYATLFQGVLDASATDR